MADFENLPADLPEDWTEGQIVSPNGTEVGLSQQHGYNYLMEQVNHTQEAVNAINASLGDVAQETTLEALDDKIGVTTDTGGTSTAGTVMGKLNKVIADGAQQSTLSVVSTRLGATTDTGGSATAGTVMGKLNAIITDAESIKTNTDVNNTASSTGTLSQKMTQLINDVATLSSAVSALQSTVAGMPQGIVRHIQRGTFTPGSNSAITISLSGFTDVNKMIVLIDGIGNKEVGDKARNAPFYISDITTTLLTLGKNNAEYTSNKNVIAGYQVIEFY